jgi:hypothetical protein
MNRAKRRLVLAVAALVLGPACTKSKDTEQYLPSERGAVQPDAGGALLSEQSACSELTTAEAAARKALGCEAVVRKCPGFIRPAGSEACFEYSQLSVKGCTQLYDSFTSCDEFAKHPCLISAVSNCDGAGEGGAGGAASGDAGASGEVGSAGSAGEGGSGG